jgi:hypothetical protein
MILSRRTSYKIANGSPLGFSPVVATELNFDSPGGVKKRKVGSSKESVVSKN